MKKEIVFESNRGVVFELTTYTAKRKLAVKNKDGSYTHMTYHFNNKDFFRSEYISWENLNCCNGWSHDKEYLFTAVQDGKKLCAGITFDSVKEMNIYLETLGSDYLFYQHAPVKNGPYSWYNVDIVRKGCIADYIDIHAVLEAYKNHIDYIDENVIKQYLTRPIIELVDGSACFDYANTKNDNELVVTGLLLGYPIETTASLINSL